MDGTMMDVVIDVSGWKFMFGNGRRLQRTLDGSRWTSEATALYSAREFRSNGGCNAVTIMDAML